MTRKIALLALLAAQLTRAGDLEELRGLLRANLPGTTEAQLDQAAVEGLVASLPNRVRWQTNSLLVDATNSLPPRAMVIEGNVGLIRVTHITPDINATLAAAELSLTNKLAGLVFDLRFADGEALESALAYRPASALPKTVLVNRETRAAAVALAATLRLNRSLLIGAHTAGEIARWQTYTLGDGRKVQIAGGTVKLADGTPVPVGGLEPDIAVEVPEAVEKIYFADAYATVTVSNKLGKDSLRFARRYSEADLVKAHREGLEDPEDDSKNDAPSVPVRTLHDPALARAVDLLKSLALASSKRD